MSNINPTKDEIKTNKEEDSRKILWDIFLEMKEIFDKVGLQFFLIGGALLGIVREGDLIEWDLDVDVGILEKDVGLLDKVDKIARERKFIVMKDYHQKRSNIPTGRVDIFGKKGFHIDVFVHYECKNMFWISYMPNESIEVYSRELLFPLSQLTFRNIIFNVPHFLEEYLEYEYGDWKTPKKVAFTIGGMVEITDYVMKEYIEKKLGRNLETPLSNIVIRKATVNDVDVISELMYEWKPWINSKKVRMMFLEIMKLNPDEHVVFIAEIDGKPVGWVYWLLLRYFVWGYKIAELQSLFVSESSRRKGVATALTQVGLDTFKPFVSEYRIVELFAENVPARNLCRKLGFIYELCYLRNKNW